MFIHSPLKCDLIVFLKRIRSKFPSLKMQEAFKLDMRALLVNSHVFGTLSTH